MPNWSYNTIVLQGKKSAIQDFIGLGLKNSNLEPTGEIQSDFDTLLAKATTKSVEKNENGSKKIVYENALTAQTFLPSPDTYLLHDTTNHPENYPAEVEEQKKLGAVGWYDYNLLTLGTKWNFCLESMSLNVVPGKPDCYRIAFDTETAWSIPCAWLAWLKAQFPELQVLFMSYEESSMWYCVGYVDENGELCEVIDLTKKHDAKIEEAQDNEDEVDDILDDTLQELDDDFYKTMTEMAEKL